MIWVVYPNCLKKFLINSFSHNVSGLEVITNRKGNNEAIEIKSAKELKISSKKVLKKIVFYVFLKNKAIFFVGNYKLLET